MLKSDTHCQFSDGSRCTVVIWLFLPETSCYEFCGEIGGTPNYSCSLSPPPPKKKDSRCVTPSQVSSLLVSVSPVFIERFLLFCRLAHESGVSGMLLS